MTERPDRGAADGRGSPTLHRGSGVVQDEGVEENRLCGCRRCVVRRPNKEVYAERMRMVCVAEFRSEGAARCFA